MTITKQKHETNPARMTARANDNAPPPAKGRHKHIKALQNLIHRMEGQPAQLEESRPGKTAPAAIDAIAATFGACHDIHGEAPLDNTSACGFALHILRRGDAPLLWIIHRKNIGEYGMPYGPGLMQYGIAPERVILVRCRHRADALWAAEEGLKTPSLAGVLLDTGPIDLNASRRLAIAARDHKSLCLIMGTGRQGSPAVQSRVCLTRSVTDPKTRWPGAGRMTADLVKHRAGRPHRHAFLEWSHETNSFIMAEELAHGPLGAQHSAPARQFV